MKHDDRRTYDFARARRGKIRGQGVRELLIDGWSAYYRWLSELQKSLTRNPRRDASD